MAVTSRRISHDQETWETRLYVSSHLPRANSWPERSVDTGASKTASTGSSMCASAKINDDSKIAMGQQTSPRCDGWESASSAVKPQTNAAPKTNAYASPLDPSYLLKVIHTARF